MKHIYFVLTDSGSVLSKIIKYFMKDEYAHVSIALDKRLEQMYSFGRLNPYNPFHGGFVHEFIYKGTFKRFKNTKARIIVINITDEQYKKLKQIIKETKRNRAIFKFNILGLFGIYFKYKRKKQNYFYCAEYIKFAIEKSNINLKLPELVRPENFKNIEGSKVIFNGLLQEYC